MVPLATLDAIETYRDGHGAPAMGWDGPPPAAQRAQFASFRLYARTLDDVAPLHGRARRLGARVRARTGEIAALQRLRHDLGRLYAVLAVCGGLGIVLALGSALRGNVERMSPVLSTFRLTGAPARALFIIPFAQSALIAAYGGALVALAATAGGVGINAFLAEETQAFVAAPGRPAVGVFALRALLLAAAAALWAGVVALRIGPDLALRRV